MLKFQNNKILAIALKLKHLVIGHCFEILNLKLEIVTPKLKRAKKFATAMTLLDAVLALAMFGIFFGFIVNLLFLGQDSVIVSGKRQEAALLAQEASAAIESIVRNNFNDVGAGDYALSTSSNRYSLTSSSVEHLGIFDRSIHISVIDYLSRSVSITVSWMQNLQRSGVITLSYNLYNWALGFIYDHTKVVFDGAYRNGVKVETSGSTSTVSLMRASDWARAILYKSYDMSGSNALSDVSMYRYYLYASKLISSGGPELLRYDVNNLSGGEAIAEKDWTFGRPLIASYFDDSLTKAYFASTNPNEISILDLQTDGISGIDVPGTVNGTDVWVNNNKIFLSKLNDASGPELEIYDTGGTRIGSAEIGANANKVIADNNFAYVASALDAGELMIVNHTACSSTTPFACPVVRQYDMTGTFDATALTHGTSTDWYIGRSNGAITGLTINDPLNISQAWTNGTITAAVKDLSIDSNERILSIAANRSATQELSFYNLNNSSLSSVDLLGSSTASSVLKYGSYVYAGMNNASGELQVVRALGEGWDNLSLKGIYNAPSTTDASNSFVDGTTAYVVLNVTSGGPELYILNVANPASPVLLGVLELNASVSDVWANGDYAYLTTDSDSQEFIAVDVSDKAHPSIVGSLDLQTVANGTAVVGDASTDTVYVGTENGTTRGWAYGIDVSGAKTTSSLKIISTYDFGAGVLDMDLDKDHKMLYVTTADHNQELQVMDVSRKGMMVKVDGYNTANNTDFQAYSVAYDPSTKNSFVGLNNNGAGDDLYIFNGANPVNITPDYSTISAITYNGTPANDATTVTVDYNGYAYLGTLFYMYIFDISNAASPVLVGSYSAGGAVWDIRVKGDYAYLATNNSAKEIQVVNISNKANPVQASFYNMAGSQSATAIDQIATTTYAGVDNSTYMYAFDTSNPNAISVRGQIYTGYPISDLSAGPDYVVLSTRNTAAGLVSIDVRNWNAMSIADVYSTTLACNDVLYEKAKDRIFLGCDRKSGNSNMPNLFVVDSKDPTNLYQLSSKAAMYSVQDMYLWGNILYLTTAKTPFDVNNNLNEHVRVYRVNTSSTLDYLSYYPTQVGTADALTFDGNYIYIAAHGSTGEFQVATVGWTTQPFLSFTKSMDLGSDNMGIVADDDYAFVATASSTAGLKVVDVSNPASPQVVNSQSTGASNGLAMSSIGDLYLSSANDSKELQIFRKASETKGYIDQGWYSSIPYNSGVSTTKWKYLSWSSSSSGAILFNLRTAPNNGGAPGTWSQWLGPTSVDDTYSAGVNKNVINNSQSDGVNDQWLQYRAILKPSSTMASPALQAVTIYYE